MRLVKWNSPMSINWPSVLDDDLNWPAIADEKNLELYETDEAVIVKAAIPGVAEDEVEVAIEGNVLTISARHEETQEDKDKKKVVYRGALKTVYNISTTLPRNVVAKNAEADVVNGILTVSIPKAEEERPNKITVKKR